jgi:hypothetical protein
MKHGFKAANNGLQVGEGAMAEYVPQDGVDEDLVPGSPEGDGDFETDELPSTGETSAGGQLDTGDAERGGQDAPAHKPTGLEFVIDEISSGKLMP